MVAAINAIEAVQQVVEKLKPKHIACFKSYARGEKIMLVRVGNNIGWYWDCKTNGKTYGDYIVYEPLVDKATEKKLDALKVKFREAGTEAKKKKIGLELLSLARYYESVKVKDVEQVYEVLINQADETVERVTEELKQYGQENNVQQG